MPSPAAFPSQLTCSGTTIVDSNGYNIASDGPLLGINVNPANIQDGAPTESDFAIIAAKGFQYVRAEINWAGLQPTNGTSVSSTYVGYIDNLVQYCYENGLYVWLNFMGEDDGCFPGATVNSVTTTAWADQNESSYESYALYYTVEYGQYAVEYLAQRYGDSSSANYLGTYAECVIGFGLNEPTPDYTSETSWLTNMVSEQVEIFGWVREYAPNWIVALAAGRSSNAAVVPNYQYAGQDGSGTQTFTGATGTPIGNFMLEVHDPVKATVQTSSTTTFPEFPNWDGRNTTSGDLVTGNPISIDDSSLPGYPPESDGTTLFTEAQCQSMMAAWWVNYQVYAQAANNGGGCPIFLAEGNWNPVANESGPGGADGADYIADKLNLWYGLDPVPVMMSIWEYSVNQSKDAFSMYPGTGSGVVGVNSDGWLYYADAFLAGPPAPAQTFPPVEMLTTSTPGLAQPGFFSPGAPSGPLSADSAHVTGHPSVRVSSADAATLHQAQSVRVSSADSARLAGSGVPHQASADSAHAAEGAVVQVQAQHLSSADSARLTEAGSVTVRLVSADTSHLARSQAVTGELASADAAHGTESQAVTGRLPGTDTAHVSEAAGVSVRLSGADSVHATPAVTSTSASLAGADAVRLSGQQGTVRVSSADEAAGSGALKAETAAEDTAHGTGAGSVAAVPPPAVYSSVPGMASPGAFSPGTAPAVRVIAAPGTDTAHLAETGTIRVIAGDAARLTGSPVITGRPGSADSAAAHPAATGIRASLTAADQAHETGSQPGIRVPAASTAHGSGAAVVRLTAADAAHLTEAARILAVSADSAHGSGTAKLTGTLAAADAGHGTDGGRVSGQAVYGSDSAAARGVASGLAVRAGDTVHGAGQPLRAWPASADSTRLAEAAWLGDTSPGDGAHGTGTASVRAAAVSADVARLTGMVRSLTQETGDATRLTGAAHAGPRGADAAHETGAAWIRVSSADTARLTEATRPLVTEIVSADSAHGTDGGVVTARPSSADSAHGTGTGKITASLSSADTAKAAGAPATRYAPVGADSAHMTESGFFYKTSADTARGRDSALVCPAAADSAVLAEGSQVISVPAPVITAHDTAHVREATGDVGIWTYTPPGIRPGYEGMFRITGRDEDGTEVVVAVVPRLDGNAMRLAARLAGLVVHKVTAADSCAASGSVARRPVSVTGWVVPAVAVTGWVEGTDSPRPVRLLVPAALSEV